MRSGGSVASQAPFLSWQSDLVAARHGIDELLRQVKQLPVTDPWAGAVAIQLVEALDAVRRERLAIRAATAFVNPMSVATATLVMAVGRLGHVDRARALLVRRAHAIAARQRGGIEERYVAAHVLARAYLAGGKPQHGLRFAVDAAQLARRAADESATALDPPPTARERLRTGAGIGVMGALTTARQAAADLFVPTYEQLPLAERWRRRCGAALRHRGLGAPGPGAFRSGPRRGVHCRTARPLDGLHPPGRRAPRDRRQCAATSGPAAARRGSRPARVHRHEARRRRHRPQPDRAAGQEGRGPRQATQALVTGHPAESFDGGSDR